MRLSGRVVPGSSSNYDMYARSASSPEGSVPSRSTGAARPCTRCLHDELGD